ncbi:MAG: extracellular solute-binding protein [Verrucomicrobia bacterium]|nr:extracellular solute-binding protein [Verrucomicrobiota bacterium]
MLLTALTASGAEPVTVKVFHLYDLSTSSGGWRGFAEAVEAFQAKHPEIHLERSTQLLVEGHTGDTGPLLAIAGGISPDIIYVNFRQSETYIQQGFLAPLDEYITKMPPDEFNERVPEPVRPVIQRRGPESGSVQLLSSQLDFFLSSLGIEDGRIV